MMARAKRIYILMIKVNKLFPFFSWNFLKEIENMISMFNGVFLSRNNQLIVVPQKFDVLKTNLLVIITSNFQGATIRPIVPRR